MSLSTPTSRYFTVSKYDQLYMDIAERLAQQSHAERFKVGSLLVKDGSIIAEGWNGTPAGWPNECEELVPFMDPGSEPLWVSKKEVLHAESNALMKVAKSTQSSEGATMYTLLSPCIECAKLIVQAGIKRLVYKHSYRDTTPLDFLTTCNVECEKIEYERTIPVGGEVSTSEDFRMYTQ